jgi:hypothetical protein
VQVLSNALMLGFGIHLGTVGSNDERIKRGRLGPRLAHGRERLPCRLRRFGITYSFGVFVGPMATESHASRTATSALFSITGLALCALRPS